MKVLSLFDGISCGRVALERAGFNVETYYASEIDKYATKVSEKNYPDIIRVGDITKWKDWDINWGEIDLVMAGSPCQGFSMAGKGKAFNDERSALFFEFVNILNHIKQFNPNVKFLLENVKMKQQYMDVITGLLGENPLFINSNLVSAQNRQRLYWANWDFCEPSDRGISLADILQDEDEIDNVHFNYNFKERKFGSSGKDITEATKAPCLLASMGTGGGNVHYKKLNKKGTLKRDQGKASCLTGGGNSGGNHSDMDIIVRGCAQRGRNIVDGKRKDYKGAPTEQRIEYRNDDKSNCLTTVQKDTLVSTNCVVRRLTPIECERLQTLPDNYTEGVSNTQRYKALGNGWTVDVIAHILRGIPCEVCRG